MTLYIWQVRFRNAKRHLSDVKSSRQFEDLFNDFLFFLQTSEIGVTEHIEGDECKFALWTGTVAPVNDAKLVLKVSIPPFTAA